MATVENPYEKVRSKMVAARLEFLSQLATFNNKEIAREPGENEWSPLQLANHLYVADGLALEQMQIVQNGDAVQVTVERSRPERGKVYLQVIVQPVTVARVKLSDLWHRGVLDFSFIDENRHLRFPNGEPRSRLNLSVFHWITEG